MKNTMKKMMLLMVSMGMVTVTFAANRQPDKVSGASAKPTVRLSVAYMAIEEKDVQKIGNSLPDAGGGVLQPYILRDLVHGSNGCNTARVGVPLDVTKRILSQGGITRMSDTWHTLIENGATDGVTFKSGGILYVKVGDAQQGIEYGVTINAKGGPVNDTMMVLHLNVDSKTIIPGEDGVYNVREDESRQSLPCPIGQTTLMRGPRDMADKDKPRSGSRFLRSIPLLNWFVEDSDKEVSERRLVIMICPEIVDG